MGPRRLPRSCSEHASLRGRRAVMSDSQIDSLWDRLRRSRGRNVDIVGQGECSLDRVLRLPGRLVELVPLLSDVMSGGKVRAQSLAQVGGGQIATALCAASRLGMRTAFAGVIGQDSDGEQILSGLRDEAVDVSRVHVLSQVPTRSALILVDAGGERLVIEHRHSALQPAPDRSDVDLLASARIVHVDATFPDSALALLQNAAAHGCLGSLDLDHAAAQALHLLEAADLSVLAAGVAAQMTGQTDVYVALRQLAQRLHKPLIATLGDQGSVLAVPHGDRVDLHHQPAFPAQRGEQGQLDTTACGDTYRAALLCSVLWSVDAQDAAFDPAASLRSAMRVGSAAAAIKCRDLGRSGCPTQPELTLFLQESAR